MGAPPVRKGLNVFSGIREADQDHPTWWAAVGVEPDTKDEPTAILEAGAAAAFGMTLITEAAGRPDQLFAPEILTMPPGAGISADSAKVFGLQLLVSATRAACELAVWEALETMGWTNTDKDRFLLEVSARLRDDN